MVWRSIGTVGVDTGSLLITDPVHLTDVAVPKDGTVAFPTGYGDGQYEVFAEFVPDETAPDSGATRIAAIHIQFIEEEG